MSTPTPTTPGPIEDAVAEATLYRVLGTCYLEAPDSTRLDELARWADRWLDREPPAPIETALEPIATTDPGAADHLGETYTRLFSGVLPDSPKPPYESLYRDGALYGPHATSVKRAYRKSGVDVDRNAGELADHLGIELHFVAELRERGDEAALDTFVVEHPLAWIDDFIETIEAADPGGFYQGVLDLTRVSLSPWRVDG
jgi:TorA maturation chaperone TorD